MTEQEKNTEDKILEAAKDVFQKKGMTGARMQEIADRAGINKALLHYYYRTKEKLFEKVFVMAFSLFFPTVKDVMLSNKPLTEKIEFFVDSYLELLLKHPYIPGFVINELNRNPEILVKMIEKNVHIQKDNLLDIFDKQIQEEIRQGNIRSIDARNLMINIIGLCVFPIVARPVIQGVMFNNEKKVYNDFLKQRKELVKEFIINSIKLR